MVGDILKVNPDALNSTIEFLTAMVTPTLLISATGSLVLSTSTRLGRVIDRVRDLEQRLSELIVVQNPDSIPLYNKRVDTVVNLLDKVTSRGTYTAAGDGYILFWPGVFCSHECDDSGRGFF